ncbi:MAG: hypothetical protein WC937_00095 [Candidatus Omnitrophota bacterium]
MLKILRHKKTAKKIWIGLALIIIPAFASGVLAGHPAATKKAGRWVRYSARQYQIWNLGTPSAP